MESAILRGIKAAHAVFGLSMAELARALQTDEGTLFDWLTGGVPPAICVSRLERLEQLAEEVRHSMRPERIASWLDQPMPTLRGETPRKMILAGQSETVLGSVVELDVELNA